MVELFVRIAVGVLVGGLLGAGLPYVVATVPLWGIGASAGAMSAVLGSWAISSLRATSTPLPVEPPDSPRQPSI